MDKNCLKVIFSYCCEPSYRWGEYIIQNLHKINWHNFSGNNNPKAVEYLWVSHPKKICWHNFSVNNNSKVVKYLWVSQPESINWNLLSLNNKKMNEWIDLY